MDFSRSTDAELLTADPACGASYAEFYRRYEEPVLVFMLRRVRGADVAADLTAEVFAAALDARRRYVVTEAPAAAWLFGIARNVLMASIRKARVIDDVRRRLGPPPLVLTDETIEHLERLGEIGLGADALARLQALPPDQRHAIEEHVIAERDYASIAVDIACSPGVVRQRVSRGLATLRAQMEAHR
jgi:RNA polymerase sigma-70 factor (ECF subfamily)